MLWFVLAATVALKTPLIRAAAVAGPGAKNCGWVGIGRDPWPAINCTVGHFKRDKPFYAWFQQQGIDSMVASGIAMNSKGEIFSLRYDSMGDFFAADRCARTEIERIGKRERLVCHVGSYVR